MNSPNSRIANIFFSTRLGRSFAVILLLAFLCLASWILDRWSLNLQLLTYLASIGFVANSIPIAIAFLFVLVISRRAIFTSLVISVLLGGVYVANATKLHVLQQPIVFNDFYFVVQVNASVIHLLSHYLSAKVLVTTVISLAVLGGLLRWERPLLKLRTVPRIVVALFLALIAVGLYRGVFPARKLYEASVLRVVPWAPAVSELRSGLLGTLVYQAIDSSTALQEPIDDIAIQHIAELKAPHSEIPPASNARPPDIVIIQSESFFDPSVLAGVGDTSKLLPVLSRARQEGSAGLMKVPTFGGGTLRTEFETLTSIPLAAFPKIEFPYLQIHAKAVPSLARVLKDDGYKAYAVHPNDANFWNRDQAFRSMGFDAFFSRKDFPANAANDGWAIADSAFTTKIEQILDKGDHPMFIMGISMEGHGPYLNNPVTDTAMRDSIPAPRSWPMDAVLEYRNYAYHINHADHELGRLWDYLEKRGRPYVLVFYGDHLPGFSKVYSAAGGLDDGQPARTQMVPWVMVSNIGFEMPTQPIYSWMTGGQILCSFEGKGNDYYSMIQKVRSYQVSHGMTFVDKKTLDGVESLSRLYLRGDQMPASIRESAKHSFCTARKIDP
jgi:phosphoglycerol transferase MdoB-like AlkP superfamily enzyme